MTPRQSELLTLLEGCPPQRSWVRTWLILGALVLSPFLYLVFFFALLIDLRAWLLLTGVACFGCWQLGRTVGRYGDHPRDVGWTVSWGFLFLGLMTLILAPLHALLGMAAGACCHHAAKAGTRQTWTPNLAAVTGACESCGYVLRGLDGTGNCPECGAAFDQRPLDEPPRIPNLLNRYRGTTKSMNRVG